MVRTEDAIAAARALIGTPYAELDCINLIKKIIRTAPGGDPRYTTAGTDELWSSAQKSAKYRHLAWRQEGLDGVGAGWLVFKGRGTDARDGEPHHVGIATGEGTVIHSSSRAGVTETMLTAADGWTLAAKHRDIEAREPEAKGMRLYAVTVTCPDEATAQTVLRALHGAYLTGGDD